MAGDRSRYSAVAIGLHWLTFAFIATNWLLGLYMVDLPLSPRKLEFFSWHKWIGATIFLMAIMRVTWRITQPPPPLPDTLPRWQHMASGLSHLLLYLLLFAIPLSGWLYSSATGIPTVFLGLLQLPDLVQKDKHLAELLKIAHISLNYALSIIVCVHIAAALKHHLIDHNEILVRMLPFLNSPDKRH